MISTIVCPHCGKNLEITEALSHQVEDKIRTEERGKAEKEFSEKQNLESEKTHKELKMQQEENDDLKKRIRESQDAELELRKKANQLEKDKESWDLDKQRQMDSERQKIIEDTKKEDFASQKFKDMEKDKRIMDLTKSVEELQRKITQGSQQLQGEVQELDLEETLKSSFATDIIQPVEKGVQGADIKQTVITSRGNTCGVILWESKRSKAWKDDWVAKLNQDLRNEKANIPILVTTVFPKGISDMGLRDGVIIIPYDLLIPVATLCRQRLIEVAWERVKSQNKGEKAEEVYAYVTGHEFQQQMEALVEVHRDMHKQVSDERKAFEKIWKVRETQIDKFISTSARIYGSIQGRAGASMPSIKGFDLPLLED